MPDRLFYICTAENLTTIYFELGSFCAKGRLELSTDVMAFQMQLTLKCIPMHEPFLFHKTENLKTNHL